jgi:hypothetical protein
MNRCLGYISFFVVAMCYGSFGLFVRSLQFHFGTFQQIFVRSLGAFFVSLLLGYFLVPKSARGLIREPRVFLFGFIFPFSIFLWTSAVTLGTVHLSVFGLYVGSLFTSPLSKRNARGVLDIVVLNPPTERGAGSAFRQMAPSSYLNQVRVVKHRLSVRSQFDSRHSQPLFYPTACF